MKISSAIYDYDDESGIASAIVYDKQGRTFCGQAQVHPQDKDMANEKTGITLAVGRAEIKHLKAIIQDKRIELKALRHLYSVLDQSNQFNKTGYEAKMLRRNIQHLKDDIEEIKAEIEDYQEDIKTYISQKEEFYQSIRKNRKGQN